MTTVGVAIPSIPPRAHLLKRALASVHAQTRPADEVAVAYDHDGEGAAVTRNRAWRTLTQDLVAFLDDDDEMGPRHLELLEAEMLRTGADLVFPWFEVRGGRDPFPWAFGKEWRLEEPHQTTITCLWRREALELIGGFPEGEFVRAADASGSRWGEDVEAVVRLAEAGGKVVHLPERTWTWWHHGSNTSGRPERWLYRPSTRPGR